MSHVSIRVGLQRFSLAVVLAIAVGAAPGVRPLAASTTKGAAVAAAPAAVVPVRASHATALSSSAWSEREVGRLDPRVLDLALSATRCAASSRAVVDPSTLTIIDYSKASTEPRMWVLDLDRRALLYEELVAHGQGSGGNFATKFSNAPDSHQTSLGLFVTEGTYVGRNGYSLRLAGLERGFNDRARERAIVIHGAPYVNDEISKGLGRLGRSHGCPAVREPVARELIDRVKGGSLVFAYYPDPAWLETSTFLNGCGGSSRRSDAD